MTKKFICPSAPCSEGAVLLGRIQKDGTVAFLLSDMKVTKAFINVAKQGRKPEERFRFAMPCRQSSCMNWNGTACNVINDVAFKLGSHPIGRETSACSIREDCRWFEQSGNEACYFCKYVSTERNIM